MKDEVTDAHMQHVSLLAENGAAGPRRAQSFADDELHYIRLAERLGAFLNAIFDAVGYPTA